MPSKTTGPDGQMLLYEHWRESANSHVETTETAKLTVVDGNVVLTVSSQTDKFMPGEVGDRWEKKYTIGGQQLAELIQKNAHRG